MSFAISVLASAKGAPGSAGTPVCMTRNGENHNGVIFHLTLPNARSDGSLHSCPLQAWERAKEIHSPVPFTQHESIITL